MIRRTEHHKLVRDRIPDIIRESGQECEYTILSEAEYRQALRQKILEEATEVSQAIVENMASELADLYEVMDALMSAYGLDRALVLAEQQAKRDRRGGFEQRLYLFWSTKESSG